jgi:hypothetical protein
VVALRREMRWLAVCDDSAAGQGIRDSACDALAAAALIREHFPNEGVEPGFTPPGADEVAPVLDLINPLHDAAAVGPAGGGGGREGGGGDRTAVGTPVFAAFHVGIMRMEGGDMGVPR